MQQNYIIFYTDDDIDDQDIFSEVLTMLGNKSKVFVQDTGKQLIDELHGEIKPDVIFLDLNMPGQNGFDTLKQIKADASLKSIPVVILTTSNNLENANKAKLLGAAMFVTKPHNFDDYKHTLSLLLAIDWRRIPPDTDTFFLNIHR